MEGRFESKRQDVPGDGRACWAVDLQGKIVFSGFDFSGPEALASGVLM